MSESVRPFFCLFVGWLVSSSIDTYIGTHSYAFAKIHLFFNECSTIVKFALLLSFFGVVIGIFMFDFC